MIPEEIIKLVEYSDVGLTREEFFRKTILLQVGWEVSVSLHKKNHIVVRNSHKSAVTIFSWRDNPDDFIKTVNGAFKMFGPKVESSIDEALKYLPIYEDYCWQITFDSETLGGKGASARMLNRRNLVTLGEFYSEKGAAWAMCELWLKRWNL